MDVGTIVVGIFSLIGGFFATLLGEWDIWLQLLFIAMALDVITGMGKCVYHCSEKTTSGRFRSSAFVTGVLKKGAVLAVVMVAVMIDSLMVSQGFSYNIMFIESMRNAVILFFWIGELFSILENCVEMGIRVPRFLSNFLEVMNDDLQDLMDKKDEDKKDKKDKKRK